MPTKKRNKSNKASKNAEPCETTRRLVEGNSCGQKTGPPSISGGGRPQEFDSLLSDALRQKLGEMPLPEQETYEPAIADEIVEMPLTKGGKAITKPVLMFFEAAADRTEAKPAQPVLIPGTNIPMDPEERVNMVKRLIARGLERAEQFKDR